MAKVHQAAPHVTLRAGDGMPMVALYAPAPHARRVVDQVRLEVFDGILAADRSEDALVTAMTRAGRVHALYVIKTDDDRRGLRLFLERRRRSDGLHAFAVMGRDGGILHGLFESVLRDVPTR